MLSRNRQELEFAEPTAEMSTALQHGPTCPACGREGMALPGAGGSDAQCCASAAPEYAGNSLRSVLVCCAVAEQTAEIVRSISCPLLHGPACGREGMAWRCRVQAALMLSAAPEYAGNSVRSVLECCSVAEPTAEIVRSISCPLQHGPTSGREGLVLPGAGGSDAQCCARICRQQSQECAGMLCSR